MNITISVFMFVFALFAFGFAIYACRVSIGWAICSSIIGVILLVSAYCFYTKDEKMGTVLFYFNIGLTWIFLGIDRWLSK